jgi:hypothetical protein
VGLCTVGFEELTEVVNRKYVYRTALVSDENAEGPKGTVELNVEWSR